MNHYFNDELLRDICKKHKITQEALGKAVGLNRSVISRYMNGKLLCHNFEVLLKIVSVLERKYRVKNAYDLLRKPRRKKKGGKNMLNKKVKQYFGLKDDPFISGNVTDYFSTPEIESAVSILVEAVERNNFIAFTGDTGVGKSLVLKKCMERLRHKKIKIISPNPLMTEKMTATSILTDLVEELSGRAAPPTMRERMKKLPVLLTQYEKKKINVSVIIDEAHDLKASTLKAVKRFWEGLGVHFSKLGMVLIGLPDLGSKLSLDGLREVGDRISQYEFYPSHTPEIVENYIQHKLEHAGGKQIFDSSGIEAITERTRTWNEVNSLCTRAMVGAAAIGLKTVNREIVDQV